MKYFKLKKIGTKNDVYHLQGTMTSENGSKELTIYTDGKIFNSDVSQWMELPFPRLKQTIEIFVLEENIVRNDSETINKYSATKQRPR